MQRPFYSILLLIVLLASTASAAVIKGKITDTKGEPLPFATVYIEGTGIGTAANAVAEYSLTVSEGTHTIVCQYMGFKQANFIVTVTSQQTVEHNFKLSEQAYEMKDVVVKSNAEDPAYAKIRAAIKRRKFHLEQVENFQSSIYLKGVIRNRELPEKIFGIEIPAEDIADSRGGGGDSSSLGIMYLCEQEADYYTNGKKERTYIRSVRESGMSNGVGLSQLPPVVSFYENNVNPLYGLSERGFISPISDNALLYYKYKFQGQFMQGSHLISKIKVIPRRAYEPLFSGTIYIVEDDWAIHSLDLLLTHKSNLEQLDTLRIEQTYLPLQKDAWIIKSQVQYPTIDLLGLGFTGNFVAVYDQQKFGHKMPDSLFNSKIISSYDSTANDKDSLYWAGNRAVPLEEDEIEDYQIKDSSLNVYRSLEYRDSVRKMFNKLNVFDLILDGYYHAGKDYKYTIRTNSLLGGLVTYNNVEGLAVTPKIWYTHRIDTSRYIYTTTGLRYGFGNTHFNAFTRISYKKYDRKWLGRNLEIGIEGGKYIHQFNPQNTVATLYNSFSTLVYGKNLMHLYERYTAAAFIKRNFANGFSFNAKAGFQRRLPLYNTTFYTWANNDPPKWKPNTPVNLSNRLWEAHNAILAKAEVSYRPGAKYVQYPKFKSYVRSKWPLFTLSYEKGFSGILNSKTDFDKWRFAITDYVNMKLLGSIEYNIAAGGFINSNYVSLPDMMHIQDNELLIASPYVSGFQLAPYYLYSNTANLYGEAHVEYNMNGLLTNKIPLFRQARWNLVTGSNTLFINTNNYYTEVYVGIDNLGFKIFRFLRVDVVRSWDHTKQAHTGIRIGIDTGVLGAAGTVSITEDKEKFTW